jgi:hypothetical protein
VLDRLRHDLARAHPGETPRFTSSFGVTDSTEADSLELMLQIADGGLYAAKHAGRDRVAIGDPEFAEHAAREGAPASARGPGEPNAGEPREGENGHLRDRHGPVSMHEAAYEEEPPSSGVEIR